MLFSSQYQALLNEWARRALEAQPGDKDAEVSKALSALIEEREKECPTWTRSQENGNSGTAPPRDKRVPKSRRSLRPLLRLGY